MTTDLDTTFVVFDESTRVSFTSNAEDRFMILTALTADSWGRYTILSHDEDYQPITVCGHRYSDDFKLAFARAFDPNFVEPAQVIEDAEVEGIAEENGQ